ncbi:haloacid dehalogenase-like hydrolase, partial [Vibrio sp. FNV 38]|nr:haloacid dehalogenase-like hydrolase [Vibrio sp. FNV 38]
MQKKSDNNVYFDVCGTLFSVNTTFDFICYYHRYNRNYTYFLLCKLLQSFIGKVAHKLFGFSMRKVFFSTIRFEKKHDLENVADLYCRTQLQGSKIDIVFDSFLDKLESNEYNVVLVSASIDPVINSLAEIYNVKCFSSMLEYDFNEEFTGKLKFDLKGNKDQILLNSKGFDSAFYSDNNDDVKL